MKKTNNARRYAPLAVAAAALLLAGYLLFVRQINDGMAVNCSTILQLAHRDPDLSSVIDLTFQLRSNHSGQVALSGNIRNKDGMQYVSRTVLFDYEMKTPGDIAIENMRYVKNKKDSADDNDFKLSFFYVPEGKQRSISVTPYRNAYLIANSHSPVFLCVNKED